MGKTRQTSINCYNQIKEEGLLSKMRLKVYEALLNNAPCTSAEAFKEMLTKNNALSQSRARFTELRELGVIKEIGTKKCSVTGRKVIEWDLTDKLPSAPKKTERVVRNITPKEAERLLNKNAKFHYFVKDNQLELDL